VTRTTKILLAVGSAVAVVVAIVIGWEVAVGWLASVGLVLATRNQARKGRRHHSRAADEERRVQRERAEASRVAAEARAEREEWSSAELANEMNRRNRKKEGWTP
jgi:hypothetical protein